MIVKTASGKTITVGVPPEADVSQQSQPQTVTDTRPLKVGDKVQYLPHLCHAFNCNQNNEYPWVIGIKKNPHYEVNPQTGEQELVEDVEELDEGHFHRTVLPSFINSPNPRESYKRLVPLRPRKPWPAVVTAVNRDDGTVDLEVESNIGVGMVTLQYRRVPVVVDPGQAVPHSCSRGMN